MVTEFLNISLFSLLGIILMLLGSFCIDLVIPCSFPEEIKKGNKAIGWISAGAYISIGIIIRTAIASSDSGFFIDESTVAGSILSTMFCYAIGVAFLMIGYLILKFINRKYDLNKEVGDGNVAAGIMVFGMLVGLGLVISGVIA
ncbi:MAG: DUF350 domain-containing protein [Eubacterium sp.]|nr:DUF350 domain-containing protein [Eubacterium sp.]